jgi:hypothetical protein
MQLYLTKPFHKLHVLDEVDVEFTGSELRFFSDDSIFESLEATAGECYEVQCIGKSNSITIEKVSMPTTRGMKIAWALDSVEEENIATSFADFQERFFDKVFNCKSDYVICEMNSHAYAFIIDEKNVDGELQVQSVSFWISDKISQKELDELITCYENHHRHIRCSKEFLKSL